MSSLAGEGITRYRKLSILGGSDSSCITFGKNGRFAGFEGREGDGEDKFVAWLAWCCRHRVQTRVSISNEAMIMSVCKQRFDDGTLESDRQALQASGSPPLERLNLLGVSGGQPRLLEEPHELSRWTRSIGFLYCIVSLLSVPESRKEIKKIRCAGPRMLSH